MRENWHGFEAEIFLFEDREAIVVFPSVPACGRLALKTEYWNAFPDELEIPLLEKGFHLCHVDNTNRWGTQDNLDRQARFVRFVAEKYGLSERIVPVGMSCGGLIAIKFAASYPELTACIYADAPVVNYMSCPCGFGVGNPMSEREHQEVLDALGLASMAELMAYRDMPLDRLPALVAAKIPLAMVAGDSDTVVPYCENGIFVVRAYKAAGVEYIEHIKPGCNHHPHGLEDPTPVVEFILKHA